MAPGGCELVTTLAVQRREYLLPCCRLLWRSAGEQTQGRKGRILQHKWLVKFGSLFQRLRWLPAYRPTPQSQHLPGHGVATGPFSTCRRCIPKAGKRTDELFQIGAGSCADFEP